MLSEGEVPPSSVVEVVVCPPGRSTEFLEGSPRPDFQMATEDYVFDEDQAFPWGKSTTSSFEREFSWIILGRLDRKLNLPRGNERVGVRVAYSLGHGLKVIAIVGETIEQREAGKTMEVVAAQTKAIAGRVTVTDWNNIVLAYIPVWAVGTGNAATHAQAQRVHAELRNFLHANVSPEVAAMTRIIYGGSVSSANCNDLASQPDIDGFFVGDASIKSEFFEIVRSGRIKNHEIGRLSEDVGQLRLS